MTSYNQLSEISVSYSCSIPKEKRKRINRSQDAYNIFIHCWNENLIELQEEFNILLLNRANEVLGIFNVSKGSSTETIIDTRLIFATALKCNSVGIILAHNHPSGNLSPSSPDISITSKIKKAGKLLEVNLLDHLIITKDGYYSFADEGQI